MYKVIIKHNVNDNIKININIQLSLSIFNSMYDYRKGKGTKISTQAQASNLLLPKKP